MTDSFEARLTWGSPTIARAEALKARVQEAEIAAAETDLDPPDLAIRHALELFHELEEERRSDRWSNGDWSEADRRLWIAHLGARNASHHRAICLLEVRQGTYTPTTTWWSADEITVDSQGQSAAYNELLRGNPVFPTLRAVADRVCQRLADRAKTPSNGEDTSARGDCF